MRYHVTIHISTKGIYMFIFNSFKALEVLAAVNAELAGAGLSTRVVKVGAHKDNLIHLYTNRGAKLVAHLWDGGNTHSAMHIRAIHRIVNKNQVYKILVNGQASANLKTLVFNGENGLVHLSSHENLTEYLSLMYANSGSPEKVKEMVERELKWAAHYNYRIKATA